MRSQLLLILTLCVLAGCATSKQAPVESREPGARPALPGGPSEGLLTAIPRPGYHVVKRGETLYSIALEYGQDYREVAVWNNLGNAAVISVGQELRVLPLVSLEPTGVPPVAAPVIEVRPLDGGPAVGPTPPAPNASVKPLPAQDAVVKQEPKGGRIAYSPQAINDLQTLGATKPADGKLPSGSAPVAVSPPTNSASEPKAALTGDDVDWIWPGNGKTIAGFNESTNKGVDISGTLGDPVLAAGPGKVVYVGAGLRGYGNLVIIKHNDTFLSAYAHNSEIFVKEGQAVQRGQKIAALGNSDADRPTLHFEIRKQGKPVDPMKFLPAR